MAAFAGALVKVDAILEHLNPRQREAVEATEGALLILAGAGSGKTRVITHRIAYLLATGRCRPAEISAVTFTNKAAGEMRDRVSRLSGEALGGGHIGTFHALGVKILRRDGQKVGYRPGFVIYDRDDQIALMKAVLRELAIDEGGLTPRTALHRVSALKNSLVTPQEAEEEASGWLDRQVAACYGEYQKRLLAANAADFDDLLVRVLELFSRAPDVAARCGKRCRYLLVDEYQDTNHVQYRIIQALAGVHGNVCVVGDPDQSIYRFRGADIRNILAFERDFPKARTVKLEQNYRSTRRILAAADGVIARNRERHEKTLWTENAEGALLTYLPAPDDRAEAEWVVDRIEELEKEGMRDEEMAVLYRTNAQSRVFEDRLNARGRPYRVVGSLRFYERKEIKDLLAYLRLVLDPDDEVAWVRAAGTPPRGIGARTLESLRALAAERICSPGAAAEAAVREGLLAERALRALRDFLDLLRDLRETAGTVGSAALVGTIVRAIDYGAYLERAHPEDASSRMENVDALMSAAEEYDEEQTGEGLLGFVDRSSLRSETDEISGERGVTLMTIHAAKGLEFDGVFLVGLEENVFPHVRSLAHESDLEEERRLCYVAMTRARHRLFLSSCSARRQFGDFVSNEPSRFLEEIPEELLDRSESRAVPVPGYRHLREGGVWGRGGSRPRAGSRSGRPRPPAGERRVVPDPDASDVTADDLRPGTWVRHPMFGEGRVLSREGEGQNLKLTIRFTDHGTKKILPRYTTLTPA